VRDQHPEWPNLEYYADVPLFNTNAAVQQTGVAAHTLRSWERRYNILSPERAQNHYRLYSERDIVIIRWLKTRVDAGMSISQATALFHHLREEQTHQHKLIQKDTSSENTSAVQTPTSTSGEKKYQPLAKRSDQKFDAEVRADTAQSSFSLPLVQKNLLDAFASLDEATASQLMASMLAIYSIEHVCTELITPTLWEIGRLWEQGLITVTVEHFASAFFHGFLTNLFHTMPGNKTNPFVIVCCAPGEEHELAPLMLALLLRRAGMHTVYLGQSIETAGLIRTIKHLSPELICVSLTMIPLVEGMIELGQQIERLPLPRPQMIFGGQAFERNANLIAQVPGMYMNGEMQTGIIQLRQMAYQQIEHKTAFNR
jgi:MerR family transcriptional regulator, light-induced transcriptional regulator